MSTTVFVQRDGIVNHSHEGVKGWHDPSAKHQKVTHADVKADAPTNLGTLNAGNKAQYAKALAGTSFYHLYATALKGRQEAGAPGTGPRQKTVVAAPAPYAVGADDFAPVLVS